MSAFTRDIDAVLGIPSFPITSLPQVDDFSIGSDLELARELLGDEDQAYYAVTKTLAGLETAKYNARDNRRERRVPAKPRAPYRPFIDDVCIRRTLLLRWIRRLQIENERLGKATDEAYDLRCFVQEIVETALHHNSFYAAVAATQVIATYTAAHTLAMYGKLAPDNAVQKDNPSVARSKRTFEVSLRKRFGSRISFHTEGGANRLVARTHTQAEVDLVSRWLVRLLPSTRNPRKIPENARAGSGYSGGLSEGINEMNRLKKFFDIDVLNDIALSVGADPFLNRVALPLISKSEPDGGPSGSPSGKTAGKVEVLDIARVKRAVFAERCARLSVRPQALLIAVDGETWGVMGSFSRNLAFTLEPGARIIEVTAVGGDHTEVTLATYVLRFSDAKWETWTCKILGMGTMCCNVTYLVDESVSVSFQLLGKCRLLPDFDKEGSWAFSVNKTSPPSQLAIHSAKEPEGRGTFALMRQGPASLSKSPHCGLSVQLDLGHLKLIFGKAMLQSSLRPTDIRRGALRELAGEVQIAPLEDKCEQLEILTRDEAQSFPPGKEPCSEEGASGVQSKLMEIALERWFRAREHGGSNPATSEVVKSQPACHLRSCFEEGRNWPKLATPADRFPRADPANKTEVSSSQSTTSPEAETTAQPKQVASPSKKGAEGSSMADFLLGLP
jgi:hypothetical protein